MKLHKNDEEKTSNKFNILRIIKIGLVTLIPVVPFILGVLGMRAADTSKCLKLLQNAEANHSAIFAETQNGTLLYVPINDEESVMEMSTAAGESLYLWLSTGQTVTISDDVMITDQKNLYEMMQAVIKAADYERKSHQYRFTVRGYDKIYSLMTEGWHLTEGQTLGSLSCYDESQNADIELELLIEKEGEKVFFTLNLFVDNTGYKIYNARILNQNIESYPAFTTDIYDLSRVNTMNRTEEDMQDYADKAIAYFYNLSTYLDIEEFN